MIYVVFGVDVFDGYYCYQYLDFGDLCWVVGEQWFDMVWFWCLYYEVDLVCRNIDVGEVVDDFVDLGDDDVVIEGGGFDDYWCVFGVWVGIEVVVLICGLCGYQGYVWGQVDEVVVK